MNEVDLPTGALNGVGHSAAAGRDAAPVMVLKLGGSVLLSRRHIARAASEVYRYARRGYRVLAVVSAIDGVTDALARRAGAGSASVHAPYLLATGESGAAALLALALEEIGMEAVIRLPHEIALIAKGPATDASLVSVDAGKLSRDLALREVVIVPGFFADNADGRRVLLGRGGTDLTAVFLGAALANARIRLIKDVDGVYEADPKKANSETADAPRRYACVSYGDAHLCASPLIQPKTVEFAFERKIFLEIAGLQAGYDTRLCEITALAKPRAQRQPLRIALLGCGVVGAQLIKRLGLERDRFEVVRTLIKNLAKPRDVFGVSFIDEPDQLLGGDIDVFVDAGNASAPSATLIEAALKSGIPTISANKKALSDNLACFKRLAAGTGAVLVYSAAVGGGAPFLELAGRAHAAGKPVRIEGVLNGTANLVLGMTSLGASLPDAVDLAKARGFAEADPRADLNGQDAAAKLTLLAEAAFGVAPGLIDITLDGITDDTIRPPGGDISLKQIARAVFSEGVVQTGVALEVRSYCDFLGTARDEENRLEILFDDGRIWRVRGKGAGAVPTTEALYADLCDIERFLKDREHAQGRAMLPIVNSSVSRRFVNYTF